MTYGPGNAGGAGIDMGYVSLTARNFSQDLIYATTLVCPSHASGQGSLVASEPSTVSDWLPLNVVNPGDAIQVDLSSFLIEDLWDTVDLSGTMLVWDLAAENLILCDFNATGVVAESSISPMGLSQVQLIGDDLSIQDGGQVISEGGGIYNILLNCIAGWD